MTDKTSAEMLEEHIAGRLIADGGDRSPKDVIAQIFARNAVQESFIVPAVAEPLIVWILKGSATVEERDIGGDWLASDVQAGDFFLTDSDEPYELRWRSAPQTKCSTRLEAGSERCLPRRSGSCRAAWDRPRGPARRPGSRAGTRGSGPTAISSFRLGAS